MKEFEEKTEQPTDGRSAGATGGINRRTFITASAYLAAAGVAVLGLNPYVDPARGFCGMYFGLASNDEKVTGPDLGPGYLCAAAKMLAGK